MTCETLEEVIADLFPGAGYCIEPQVLVKPGLPRRVEIKVWVWMPNRTMIHTAATNEEIVQLLKRDLRRDASRVAVGDLTKLFPRVRPTPVSSTLPGVGA